MKLLISLFLTVVCVHCIPLYDDGKGNYTETHTSHINDNNGTLRLKAGVGLGFHNGTVVVKTDDSLGPEFFHYNDPLVRTFVRAVDTTPPPPNSEPTICGENCILIPPTDQWLMQNRPSLMPSNPLSIVINQRDMSNGQWGMSNHPLSQLYTQWVVPNKQLVITNYPPAGWSNYPIYATSNVAPNGAPNDLSQQNPSYGPNYISGRSTYPTYVTSDGAVDEITQKNPSYGPNNPSGRSNFPTYAISNGALNGAVHDKSQQKPSYAQLSTSLG